MPRFHPQVRRGVTAAIRHYDSISDALEMFQQFEPSPVASFVDDLDQADGLGQNDERQNHQIQRNENLVHQASELISLENVPSAIGPIILQK